MHYSSLFYIARECVIPNSRNPNICHPERPKGPEGSCLFTLQIPSQKQDPSLRFGTTPGARSLVAPLCRDDTIFVIPNGRRLNACHPERPKGPEGSGLFTAQIPGQKQDPSLRFGTTPKTKARSLVATLCRDDTIFVIPNGRRLNICHPEGPKGPEGSSLFTLQRPGQKQGSSSLRSVGTTKCRVIPNGGILNDCHPERAKPGGISPFHAPKARSKTRSLATLRDDTRTKVLSIF